MAYTKNVPAWAPAGAPGISAARLNHMETQYDEADTDLDAHKINQAAGDGRHRWTADKLLKGAGAAAPTEIDVPAFGVLGIDTTFQAIPATAVGAVTNITRVNDGLTVDDASVNAVDAGAQILFYGVAWLTQYRQWGSTNNNGDGTWKLQNLNPETLVWEDWITGIATRPTADWSGWTSNGTILSAGIRLIAVTMDTQNNKNYIKELEVKY